MAKKTETKVWYQSKTLWFNVIMFTLDVVSLAQTNPLFADKQQVLTALGTIQTVGNVALRFVTDKPLTLKK